MTRSSGEGTIEQLPSGKWRARIPVKGRRKSFTTTTQRKAREWLTGVRRDLDKETYVDPSDMPLGEWWDTWIKTYKQTNVKPATLATYASSRARLTKELKQKPISQITRADIQGAVNDVTGRSYRTVELTLLHLTMCFKAAVKDKKLKYTPCFDIELPPEDDDKIKILDDLEYDALVDYCKSPPILGLDGMTNKHYQGQQTYKDCLLTILYTGMRREEAIQLTWSDWSGEVLQVNGTKTKKSKRKIILDAEVVEIFERRRKSAKGIKYIFETSNATPLMPRNLFRHIQGFNGHGVHDLRHTFATRAIMAGVDAKTLSEILGHADVSTTLRLYVHPTDDSKRQAVKKIADARIIPISQENIL